MSGHSKWSTIKHQKATTDAKRSQIFTKIGSQITIAVKEGGKISDPETNFRLRLMIEKAKSVNMPKENIQRAIERGKGALGEGNDISEINYEGFGPGGCAILVSCITDNKTRTASVIKNVFSINNGNLAGMGSVEYLFSKLGKLTLEKTISEEQLLALVLEVGAEDLMQENENFIIYTQPNMLHQIKTFLESKQQIIKNQEIFYKPNSSIIINDNESKQLLKLISALEELEDVHAVYVNVKL